MSKRYIGILMSVSALLALSACGNAEPEDVSQGVVVNNGGLTDPNAEPKGGNPTEVAEDYEDNESSEDNEGVEVPEREVYSDSVPKTGRDKIIQDSIRSEIPYGDRNQTDDEHDLSVEYVTVNGGNVDSYDFSIPYSLYYTDNSRAVGGEGVVSYGSLGNLPEKVNESDTRLYELDLLSTSLFDDERGLEGRNKVQVTKQAYNLIVELNQSIYNTLDPSVVDNRVYVSVEALYQNDTDTYPYGIHYQAQSVHGDVSFNYIVNNVQNGYTVNYSNGTVRASGADD